MKLNEINRSLLARESFRSPFQGQLLPSAQHPKLSQNCIEKS